MAKTIHLRLTGRAEEFLEKMNRIGLNERDVIAKALWLLETALTTKKVAMLDTNGTAEYIFTMQGFITPVEDPIQWTPPKPTPFRREASVPQESSSSPGTQESSSQTHTR